MADLDSPWLVPVRLQAVKAVARVDTEARHSHCAARAVKQQGQQEQEQQQQQQQQQKQQRQKQQQQQQAAASRRCLLAAAALAPLMVQCSSASAELATEVQLQTAPCGLRWADLQVGEGPAPLRGAFYK